MASVLSQGSNLCTSHPAAEILTEQAGGVTRTLSLQIRNLDLQKTKLRWTVMTRGVQGSLTGIGGMGLVE